MIQLQQRTTCGHTDLRYVNNETQQSATSAHHTRPALRLTEMDSPPNEKAKQHWKDKCTAAEHSWGVAGKTSSESC